jgi:hypothetical protein
LKTILLVSSFLLLSFTCNSQSAKISLAELPAAARTFLNEYYKYRPIEFVRKKDKIGAPYEVKLAQGTQICFAENGEWCTVNGGGSSLPKAMLPDNVAEFVKENYPKKRIVSIERDSNGIGVNLNSKIELEFDAYGKLLK